MKPSICSFWIICYLVTASPIKAEILPDTTLPTNSSVKTQDGITTITGGTVLEQNLFHSFKEFSIGTANTAYFNNQPDIKNIFSRVTGSSISNIDGLIKANTGANLFLLNPNGIIFGRNASLNLGGSFVATTASSVKFADGTEFSAKIPQETPLLTVSVPSGLQFGANVRNIEVKSSRLEVKPGKTLALVGGDVTLLGREGRNLIAPGGRIELAGVSEAGMIGLLMSGNNFSLNFPDGLSRADISLVEGARLDVTDKGQGSITITGKNLNIIGGSRIDAGVASKQQADTSPPGDVTLNATDTVKIDRQSQIGNNINVDANGNSGNINIIASSLLVTDGSRLSTSTRGRGNAGNVIINARERVWFDGRSSNGTASGASSNVHETAKGNGGDIYINAASLLLTNGAQLFVDTNGDGDAGSVIINARDTVSLDSNNGKTTAIFNRVLEEGKGKSGGIKITTGVLSLANNAQLNSVTQAQENAGNIIINAIERVSFASGSGIFANVDKQGRGQGGNIKITTSYLSLTDRARLFSLLNGQGAAGNIIIEAPKGVSLDGRSLILGTVGTTGKGKGGNIEINTSSLSLTNDSQLNVSIGGEGSAGSINVNTGTLSVTNGSKLITSTDGRGDAGIVSIQARDRVNFERGNIFSGVDSKGKGNSGGILITAGTLSVTNGSRLFASADGQGNGGNIIILVPNQIEINNGGRISVNSTGLGSAGNIFLQTKFLVLDNQASIAAQTTNSQGGNINIQIKDLLLLRHNHNQISSTAGTANAIGDGGNITINAKDGFVVSFPLQNNDITANAFSGSGGRVDITAKEIFYLTPLSRNQLEQKLGTSEPTKLDPSQLPTNDITAISQQNPSLSGQVNINTPDVDPNRGLIQLPAEPINIKVAQGCQATGNSASIAFFNTGRGGIAPTPYEPLSSSHIWEDVPQPTQSTDKIVEAQRWHSNEKGEVILVAEGTTPQPQTRCSLHYSAN